MSELKRVVRSRELRQRLGALMGEQYSDPVWTAIRRGAPDVTGQPKLFNETQVWSIISSAYYMRVNQGCKRPDAAQVKRFQEKNEAAIKSFFMLVMGGSPLVVSAHSIEGIPDLTEGIDLPAAIFACCHVTPSIGQLRDLASKSAGVLKFSTIDSYTKDQIDEFVQALLLLRARKKEQGRRVGESNRGKSKKKTPEFDVRVLKVS